METRFSNGSISVRARQLLGVVIFLCAAQQAAVADPLDPTYGAGVRLFNLTDYFQEGQNSAGGSLVTGEGGAVVAEGGASFTNGSNVNVTSIVGRGVDAQAYIFDTLTFHVVGGGFAQVPVSIAGNWTATDFATVTFDLILGSTLHRGHGYTTDYVDGTLESAAFTHTRDDVTGVSVGSYRFDTLWSVGDGQSWEILAGVKAEASGGAGAYIDDPLTINLPPGVTFTSASNTTYAAPVPEPSTLLLLGGGIVALARRRKRARHS